MGPDDAGKAQVYLQESLKGLRSKDGAKALDFRLLTIKKEAYG